MAAGAYSCRRPGMVAMLPTISPDGAKIAFVSTASGHPASIFVIDRDGGALQAVVTTEPKGIVEPAWSPNGKSLVLGTAGYLEDKTVPYRFDFAGKVLSVMPGSEGLWSPRWSPDGRRIAALRFRNSKLILYDVTSHERTELTHAEAAYPAWAHNGRYIYFRHGEKNEGWYRIDIGHREIERIASLNDAGALPAKPSRGIPAWINSWTGLTPEDSQMIATERGSIEVYSAPFIEH